MEAVAHSKYLAHEWNLAAQDVYLLLQALLRRGEFQVALLLLIGHVQKVGDEVRKLLWIGRQVKLNFLFPNDFEQYLQI